MSMVGTSTAPPSPRERRLARYSVAALVLLIVQVGLAVVLYRLPVPAVGPIAESPRAPSGLR